MKILTLDIETVPNIAHVWGLWQQNVAINQIVEPDRVLCFAAKWYGSRDVEFYSEWHPELVDGGGRFAMVSAAHALLNEADAVVHYNGNRFDIPLLNREFLVRGLSPPRPYKNIDLLDKIKRKFRFPSNKLDYVSRELGIGQKVKHEGHELWSKVMAGDDKARARMRKYNIGDVKLTEKLYDRILPWIDGHPNLALHDGWGDLSRCSNCGSAALQRRGYAYTATRRFQQYQCMECGKWLRSSKSLDGVELQGVAT